MNGGTISDCSAASGGGVYVTDGTASFVGATVHHNDGGGIRIDAVSLTLFDTSVSHNVATLGGGIRVAAGGSVISTIAADGVSELSYNAATSGGGIMIDANALVTITGPDVGFLRISSNEASDDGGGIAVAPGALFDAQLSRVSIISNTAGDQGGGLATGSVALKGATVQRNRAASGAGLYANCVPNPVLACRIEETSFAFNVAELDGGAVASGATGSINLVNVSSHDNRAKRGGALAAFGSASLRHTTSFEDVSRIGSTVAALGSSAYVQFFNSALLGSCHTSSGGTLESMGGNAQLAGAASCALTHPEDLGTVTAAQAAAAYGNYGGGFSVVGIDAASVLANAGKADWCEQYDVRGYVRQHPCDIGAFEFGGTPR